MVDPQDVLLQVAMVHQFVDQHAGGGAYANQQHDMRVVQAAQDVSLLQKLLLTLWQRGGVRLIVECWWLQS